ncbi:MAG: acyl-CoA dehydrogenase family protein [Roseiarcus sp.]|jgi:alkylation response protein AidB-like acyl-CoA dehydrogenase
MNFNLTEEQKALQAQVAEFADKVVAPGAQARDQEAKFPVELYKQVGELGVTRIPFEEKWGGMGLGTFESVLAYEQLARADQSLALSTMVSVGTGLLLSRFGSEGQKEKYLGDIVSGKALGAIAGTEPQAGSDTSAFATRARPADGGWAVNGEKAFITNSGTDITSVIVTLVVTSDPSEKQKTFSLFAVPGDAPGLKVGPSYRKMGWRSSDTHPLFFDDCRIGADALLGEAGQGRYLLHKGYQQARIFLAACSLGLAQACLERSLEYANERQAFGGPIGRLQLVQKTIAEMALKIEAARLLVYRTAWMVDQGTVGLKDLSMAKWYATEIGTECANAAIQVHGGWGFMDDCPVSRYYRDNRICTIGDGTSDIQALVIARGLGLKVEF